MIISDPNLGEGNIFIILLSNFYQELKMGTLSIEFKDITISLQEKRKEVNEAVVFCPRALQVNKEFSAGGDDLLSHYNCLKFDSDEVLFLKLNSSLLLSSEKKGKLLVSNYYPDVHEKWDLPVELNDTIIEPEEFREKAENANSLRCYQSGEEGLEIYHNQPDNKHQIGLIDLKNKSILDCSEEIIDGDFILSSKGEAIAKVKNWNIYQHARKVMFAFGDATIYNEKCIISNCNPEDIIEEFKREIAKLINKKDGDGNTLLHHATMKGDLDKAKLLVEKGADIHEKNNFNMTSLDVAYKYKQKKVARFLFNTRGNEDGKQRHRRHIRHENHHMGHRNYHSPIQEVASSAVRSSSWVNVFVNTVVGAIKGVSQFISSPFKPAIGMEPSKAITAQGIDTNSTLLLLDVFIRKITGQKYISTTDQPMPLLEARSYALNITTEFKKVLKDTAKRSGVLVNESSFNYFKTYQAIEGKMISGELSKIPTILYSAIEEAYPKNEKFLSTLKGSIEKMLDRQQMIDSNNQEQSIANVDPPSSLNSIAVEPANNKSLKVVTFAGQVG